MNFSNIRVPLFFLLLTLTISFYFPRDLLSQGDDSIIIDIRGATYARLDLLLSLTDSYELSNPTQKMVYEMLEKNLRWSGLFNVYAGEESADVILRLSLVESDTIRGAIITPSDIELYSSQISIVENPWEMEEKVIQFINALSQQLTGERSVLGTAIIYSEQRSTKEKNIVLVDTHGRRKKPLIQNGNYNLLPRWTPDGEGFLYTALSNDGVHILEYKFENNSISTISKREGISSGGTWGPNKDELIITIANQGNPDLFKVNREGRIIKRLTYRSSIDTSPSWSPDGNSVLFVSNRSGTAQIYQMNLADRDIFRMTFEGGYNTEPRWSNDGAYILFAGTKRGISQIYLMDRDGEHIRQLTYGRMYSDQPDWSPDGRQVIFTSEVNGDPKIFIMTTDGAYRRRLTNSGKGVRESHPTWTSHFRWNLLSD